MVSTVLSIYQCMPQQLHDASQEQPTSTKPLGRFAPSPTGRMHIGNIVAAVAAWAACAGNMLLRVEDVDTDRARPDADRWIMDDLHWLGLDWVGEPQYQSQRLHIYHEALRFLPVYPCTCTRAQIRAASAPQESDGVVVYPGTCRPEQVVVGQYGAVGQDLAEVQQHATVQKHVSDGSVAEPVGKYPKQRASWRLAVPQHPDDPNAVISFRDEHAGFQQVRLAAELGDTVMRRSDGLFGYQLAVSVDDALMGVTQIVRGCDLLRSTALQLYIRRLLCDAGFLPESSRTEPEFAHIGLIRNARGVRMAKRLRALDMATIRELGLTAQQVLGLCAQLLGLQEGDHPLSASELPQLWQTRNSKLVYRDSTFDVAQFLAKWDK